MENKAQLLSDHTECLSAEWSNLSCLSKFEDLLRKWHCAPPTSCCVMRSCSASLFLGKGSCGLATRLWLWQWRLGQEEDEPFLPRRAAAPTVVDAAWEGQQGHREAAPEMCKMLLCTQFATWSSCLPMVGGWVGTCSPCAILWLTVRTAVTWLPRHEKKLQQRWFGFSCKGLVKNFPVEIPSHFLPLKLLLPSLTASNWAHRKESTCKDNHWGVHVSVVSLYKPKEQIAQEKLLGWDIQGYCLAFPTLSDYCKWICTTCHYFQTSLYCYII